MVDISTRQQTEAWLKERDQFHAILDATDVMLVYLDLDFNFVIVNHAYAETCRMRPEEMVGKNHFTLYPNAENEAIFRQVRDTGNTVFFKDKPFEFPDQPERGVTYWDWSLAPVKDHAGLVQGLVFSLRETTEFKKIELALHAVKKNECIIGEQKQMLEDITQGITEGILLLSKDYRILWANKAVSRQTGLSPDELIGNYCYKATHNSDCRCAPPSDPCPVHDLLSNGAERPNTVEHVHQNRTGSPVFVEVSAYPIKDHNGEVVKFVHIAKDITERKKSEKDLQDKADQIFRQNSELLEINSELSVLYTISKSLSRTINIEELFSDILKTLMGLKIFQFHKAIIFFVEGDKMSIAAHIGIDEPWVGSHQDMMIGNCLCGLAAKTGQVILSTNSDTDTRHTIRDLNTPAHGHIIVPLKNVEKVVGVLCLFLMPDLAIEEKHVNLLVSVANQMGLAIKNAKLYEETRELSLHDPLTELANRRYMGIVFDQIIAQSKRYNGLFSLIMLDIDYFKTYNDTYGHPAGDDLLRQIARLLLDAVREIDLVVRYGGEEFLVLLHNAGAKEAYETAERIRKLVEDKTSVTVSLGVSSFHTGTLKQKKIIDQADKALYLAKNNGRNRVVATV